MFVAGSAEELEPVSDKVSRSVDLVKHIPVIAVPKGNPDNITSIEDLASGIGVVTGDPEATPIGKIAMKMFADAGISGSVISLRRQPPRRSLLRHLRQESGRRDRVERKCKGRSGRDR